MPKRINIKNAITTAFQDAKLKAAAKKSRNTPIGKIHADRSKEFVKALALLLQEHYSSEGFCVFSHKVINPENQAAFKRQEFLYDILLAKTSTIDSAAGKTELKYLISPAEWVIESEFNRSNSRESIIDFSKLVIAHSNNKLMVLPNTPKMSVWARKKLPEAIPDDNSQFYIALVPHPKDWGTKDEPSIDVISFQRK